MQKQQLWPFPSLSNVAKHYTPIHHSQFHFCNKIQLILPNFKKSTIKTSNDIKMKLYFFFHSIQVFYPLVSIAWKTFITLISISWEFYTQQFCPKWIRKWFYWSCSLNWGNNWIKHAHFIFFIKSKRVDSNSEIQKSPWFVFCCETNVIQSQIFYVTEESSW